MGEIPILNDKQKTILKEFSQDPFFSSSFYFTGGTALSAYYLQHRESVDLDFFSEKKFDTRQISTKVEAWRETHQFTLTTRFVDPLYIFFLRFPDGQELKVDFNYYPYKHIEDFQKIEGIRVDSKLDIAVNKLLTVTQRTEVKDFVDLFFLLQDYSFWDLRVGVERKFRMEIEPLLIAADFLAVEEFEFLPKMLKPLTLEELKEFYRELAKKLGKQSVG
jgi:predicted nucleotidyltransferase component of viral defense system